MQSPTQEQHRWLHKLLGDWTIEGEAVTGSDESQQYQGREHVRALGEPWVLCEGGGDMPGGGTMQSVMTLGYDEKKGRFVGTFVASMMTYLWVYDGALEGNRLDLYADGPDFTTEGKTAHYRDTIEFLADDHRTLTSHVQGDDGQWRLVMRAHYRRTPA